MKNAFKVWIIAFVAIIGFTMTACAPDPGDTTIAVTAVSLDRDSLSFSFINHGKDAKTETLSATISPANATNQSVIWSSSDSAVASVTAGVVTAKKAGTATITVMTEDGSKTDECTVTVTESLIDMVRLNAGTFMMGSPEEEPGRNNDETSHSVTLTTGFYMGTYQVTQAQYEEVTGTNPSSFTISADGDNPGNRPVESVTWYDVVEFCNKLSVTERLEPVYTITGRTPETGYPITDAAVTADFTKNGYRLPTEAQWEYACRAGTTAAFNWGTDTINDAQANYRASSVDANNTTAGMELMRTTEVGSYEPNAWGLYDMHGNVWEWCGDWYDTYPDGVQSDPTGAVSGSYRVTRGGSWGSDGLFARSACRSGTNPSSTRNIRGFRLVRP